MRSIPSRCPQRVATRSPGQPKRTRRNPGRIGSSNPATKSAVKAIGKGMLPKVTKPWTVPSGNPEVLTGNGPTALNWMTAPQEPPTSRNTTSALPALTHPVTTIPTGRAPAAPRAGSPSARPTRSLWLTSATPAPPAPMAGARGPSAPITGGARPATREAAAPTAAGPRAPTAAGARAAPSAPSAP